MSNVAHERSLAALGASEAIDRKYMFSTERPGKLQEAVQHVKKGNHAEALAIHTTAAKFHDQRAAEILGRGRRHPRTNKNIGREQGQLHKKAANAHREAIDAIRPLVPAEQHAETTDQQLTAEAPMPNKYASVTDTAIEEVRQASGKHLIPELVEEQFAERFATVIARHGYEESGGGNEYGSGPSGGRGFTSYRHPKTKHTLYHWDDGVWEHHNDETLAKPGVGEFGPRYKVLHHALAHGKGSASLHEHLAKIHGSQHSEQFAEGRVFTHVYDSDVPHLKNLVETHNGMHVENNVYSLSKAKRAKFRREAANHGYHEGKHYSFGDSDEHKEFGDQHSEEWMANLRKLDQLGELHTTLEKHGYVKQSGNGTFSLYRHKKTNGAVRLNNNKWDHSDYRSLTTGQGQGHQSLATHLAKIHRG